MSRDPLTWFSLYKTYQPRAVYNRTDRMKPWQPPPLVKSKVAKNILTALALGAGGALVTMSPAGAVYFMVQGAAVMALNKRRYKLEVRRLERKGYVAMTKTPEGFALKLLKKARGRLKGIVFDDLVLPQEKKWDGKWRFFTFDIPEKRRAARDMLRRKLKDLGMFNVQRSVFAYPHDCRKELEFIADYYGINSNATYIESGYTDIDRELRRHFGSII